MQVRVIQGQGLSSSDAFNALIYKPPDEQLSNYLAQNMQRATDMIGNVSGRFVDTAIAMYDKFNSSSILNASKALVHSMGSHTNQNIVLPMNYDNMGQANFTMQQYIIAHPKVNKMYQDNMCNGFEETYFDMEPGVEGTDRNDYQRVMDGVLQFDGDDGYFTQYTNTDDVEDLDSMDKFAILETWSNVDRMLLDSIDPTDPNRGRL